MRHPIAVAALLLLALSACAGGGSVSGPYLGGAAGGTLRGDARSR